MTIGVRTFFEPKGIIIAGARSTPGFGFGIPASMKAQGWGDRLFLVSPRGGELEGLPVYKSIKDVPGPADLAVVIVPARIVPQTLEELADYGIRHVIIESAGFAETGMEGKALQAQIREIALDRGLRVIGPNCVGVINTANRFATAEVLEEVYHPRGAGHHRPERRVWKCAAGPG